MDQWYRSFMAGFTVLVVFLTVRQLAGAIKDSVGLIQLDRVLLGRWPTLKELRREIAARGRN